MGAAPATEAAAGDWRQQCSLQLPGFAALLAVLDEPGPGAPERTTSGGDATTSQPSNEAKPLDDMEA